VSVGETLTEARLRAGLTVDELSERTRIRETVIRCIEQDDYDACGGDVFVRGYVRALASAIGIDAQPLIRDYDRAHTDTSGDTFAHVARVAAPVPPADPAVTSADLPFAAAAATTAPAAAPADPAGQPAAPPPAADPDVTSADLPVVSADPDVTAFDLPPVPEDPAPTVADLPVVPAAQPLPPPSPPPPRSTQRPPAPAGHRNGRGSRRRVARIAVPAVLLLAVAGVASGLAISSQPGPTGKNAAAVTRPSTHAPGTPLASHSATPAAPATSAAPASTPPTTPAAPRPATVTSLPIASAAAFGPDGLADGDNSQIAPRVIARGASSPWQSQWYATAHFGSLKQGTGLLLDLGRTATISNVRIDMGSYQGASLQLRVGGTAGALSGLKVAATASDAGGTVRLNLRTPEQARYVLIWFTLLPPNGDGQYQATVYHVVVNGRSLLAMTGASAAAGTAAWTG
jgi:Helix-turn-helix domain